MFEAGAIAYRLQMVGAELFQKEADRADSAVRRLGTTSKGTATQLEQSGRRAAESAAKYKQLAAQAQAAQVAGGQVGRVFLGAGLAVAAGITLAVVKFAQYDKALDSLGANSGATGNELAALGDEAIDAGRKFGYSAVEAVGAEEALAKAGVSTSSIMGGALVGSLTLAAAGSLGVADAAEVASIAMTQFKLTGKDVPHIADLIAAGAGKAVGDVSDMSMALRQGGLVASQFNLSLEDTVGTLAAFASNGLIGSDSGTSLKTMLLALASPTGKAKDELKKYNIEAYDTAGHFIGITALAGQLKGRLSDLSEEERNSALSIIFGNDAIRAANVLYKEGAEGISDWIDNVDDGGYAAEQARKKLDNLSGDVGKLGATFDKALIKSGSAANDVLREMVQDVTALVEWYSNLDEGTQGAALAFGVGAAGVLLLSGTIFTIIPKIADFKGALDLLHVSMGKVAVIGGIVGIALTAIVSILGAVAGANADAAAKTEQYGDTLDTVTGQITGATRDMVKANLAAKDSWAWFESDSAFDNAEQLGVSLDTATDAALGSASALRKLKEATEIAGLSTEELDRRVKASGLTKLEYVNSSTELRNAVIGESDSIDEAIRIAQQKQDADGDTVDANGEVETSYDDVAVAVDTVTTSLQDLAKQIDESNGKNLDAREALRQLEESYDTFDATLQAQKDAYEEANGTLDGFVANLDITTEAGRQLQDKLDDIAQSALDSGKAVINAGGGYDEYKAALIGSRDQLLLRIADLGITGDAATNLADEILRIPSETEWRVRAQTAQAEADLQAFVARWGSNNLINLTGTGSSRLGSGTLWANGGRVTAYANGGAEHHVAQFARAGDMRVWAEPETGGEWYIPAAPSKRQRSTQLLAQAADEFGYQLVSKGARSFADGGRSSDEQIMGGSTVTRERPIELDGKSVGFFRELANGEARIVLSELGRSL